MGLHRVGHDWRDLAAAAAASFGRKRAMGARERNRKKVEWSECVTKSKNKFVSVKCSCGQGLRYKVCKCIFAVNWKVKVKVPQPCWTLCDPTDYTVHGILQARILECVAFPFSRGSSQPRDQSQVSHIAGGFFTSWTTREVLFSFFALGHGQKILRNMVEYFWIKLLTECSNYWSSIHRHFITSSFKIHSLDAG